MSNKLPFTDISIHAPAKGATVPVVKQFSDSVNFNPRSREGSDSDNPCTDFDIPISIHAPAKGATSWNCVKVRWRKHFNPRSREGSDCTHQPLLWLSVRFQSTLPRRERQNAQPLMKCWNVFQSTLPRRERLLIKICISLKLAISIHAPAKGAT